MTINREAEPHFLSNTYHYIEKIYEYIPTKPIHISIALAVASFALVFFTNISFTMSFVILGAMTAVAIYYTRSSKIINDLKTKLDSSNKTDSELTKIKSDLKCNTEKLSTQNNTLKLSIETLTSQNTKLTLNVDTLKELNTKLNENNTQYSDQNIKLKENVTVLTDQNGKLKENINTMLEQNCKLNANIQSLERENQKLDASVKGLEKEVAVLHTHVSNLRGIVEMAQEALKEFQEERKRLESVNNVIEEGSKRSLEITAEALKKISNQLEESKKLSATVSEYLKEEVKEGVYQLNRAIKEATTDNFLTTAYALTEAKQELTAVTEQINSAKALLNRELEAYENLRKRFEATESDLATRTKQLGRMADKVEDAIDKQILVHEFINQGISPYASPCKINPGFNSLSVC